MKEDEELYKNEYAKQLLKSGDPFKAALVIFPDNVSRALRVANEWATCSVVRSKMDELISSASDECDFLPTKADLSRIVWDKLNHESTSNDDFTKMAKLYAEVRGFIEKPQTNIQQNNISQTNNNIMVIKDKGTNDEWETKLRRQQEKLVNGS